MSERIVIAGAGTTGFQIARHLVADNKDVVIIEENDEAAKYALNHLDCMVINAGVNHLPTLQDAGLSESDFFISVTGNDELNIVACGLVASEFNVRCKIARVRNPDYATHHKNEHHFMDVDYFVNPELEAAQAVVASIEMGATSDVMNFDYDQIQMRNIIVDNDSTFINKKIDYIYDLTALQFVMVGISRGEEFFIPERETIIKSGDELYLAANPQVLEELFSIAGRPHIRIKNILLVGGGRVGTFVADILTKKTNKSKINRIHNYLRKDQINLKIVDANYEHCKLLSERFTNAVIINNDISEEGFFEEESLSGNDLIVTTTDNPELNILVAIYAKSLGIKRSIALVNKFNYLTVAAKFGADVIISPKYSVVSAVLKFIRRGRVKSVSTILSGHAEVVESILDGSRGFVGRTINAIRMPVGSKIIMITRNGLETIATPNLELNDKDKLTIVSKTESISHVEEMFNF